VVHFVILINFELKQKVMATLVIRDIAPDFSRDINGLKFHEWLGDSWGLIFAPC
jgi:hypothetical protein